MTPVSAPTLHDLDFFCKEPNDYVFMKIGLFGAIRSGKDSLINRYCKGKFSNFASKHVSKIKNTKIKDKDVKALIFPFDGLDADRPFYGQGANVAIIVYDVTDAKSFQKAGKLLEEIKSDNQVHFEGRYYWTGKPHSIHRLIDKQAFKILVGTKCDLIRERKVDYQEGKELAKNYEIVHMETSSKEDRNVTELFEMVMTAHVERLFPEECKAKKS